MIINPLPFKAFKPEEKPQRAPEQPKVVVWAAYFAASFPGCCVEWPNHMPFLGNEHCKWLNEHGIVSVLDVEKRWKQHLAQQQQKARIWDAIVQSSSSGGTACLSTPYPKRCSAI